MIKVDLHNHTKHSHGKHSVQEMYEASLKRGLTVLGFSEHSPRPANYNYPNEYREKLNNEFPVYASDVAELKKNGKNLVLLGVEVDWFDKEQEFIKNFLKTYDFDYAIGSVHFLGTWGFDANPDDWKKLSKSECYEIYAKYFKSLKNMIQSGLFQIAGHFDLIKIFSIDHFHTWLAKDENIAQVEDCLKSLKDADMCLEISSAGLRKVCKEIYPCKKIMKLAKKLSVPICFSSDAHSRKDIADNFEKLENYAQKFDYSKSFYYYNHEWHSYDFTKKSKEK